MRRVTCPFAAAERTRPKGIEGMSGRVGRVSAENDNQLCAENDQQRMALKTAIHGRSHLAHRLCVQSVSVQDLASRLQKTVSFWDGE